MIMASLQDVLENADAPGIFLRIEAAYSISFLM